MATDARYQAKNAEFHLHPNELKRLIDHTTCPRDRLIISLFVYTGLRRAELQKIHTGDVDYSRRRLVIRCGKGGKQRIVFLTDSLVHDLRHYTNARDGFLFAGRDGRPMSLRNINYIVSRTAQRAGIAWAKRITFAEAAAAYLGNSRQRCRAALLLPVAKPYGTRAGDAHAGEGFHAPRCRPATMAGFLLASRLG
jgi:integrase